MNIKRVLVAVNDRKNLLELCSFLNSKNVEIVADDTNYNYLREFRIHSIKLKDFLGASCSGPELLYNAAIHLDRNDSEEASHFDMVIANFGGAFELEKGDKLNIDTGKLALISASVKNYRDVVSLTDPDDYSEAIDNITYCGDILLQKRRKLALKGLYTISSYVSAAHKEFSQVFASEKYEYIILQYIMPLLSKSFLYKIEGYPGLLDDVHLANPAVGIDLVDVQNAATFMRLYNLFGDISAFISNGKVLHVSANSHIDKFYSGHGVMYASSFTIDYSTIRKLSALGVTSFCGVFNGEAVRFAHENDLRIFTIPDKSVLVEGKEYFFSSENYLVKKENTTLNLEKWSKDEKLAIASVMSNPVVSAAICDRGEARVLNTGVVDELLLIMKGLDYNSGSVLALNIDPSATELIKLESMGFKKILIPGLKGDHKSNHIQCFLK
ncbi:hypothetical protein [Kosmotoga pacifica]|uniref:hypothetical protein n=1 Tax=Kosmotoga pacifica TaxID=1330330 RepID=UPI00069AEE47|nr:hypothetical protein [Kosmotoga pacifica]